MATTTAVNGKQTNTLVPAFRIEVQGRRLQSDVLSITVHEAIDTPTMFSMQLSTWNTQKQDWLPHECELGDAVTIFLGYSYKTESVISGEVTGLEPEFIRGEIPTLTIRGYDRGHRLFRGCNTQTFTRKKDSDIVKTIAKKHGLKTEVEDTKEILDYVLQHNQTDWDFLKDRAQKIGYELATRNNTLFFRSYQYEQDKQREQSSLTLSRREDLLSFSAQLSSLTQVKQVEVRGWNPKQKKVFTVKSVSDAKSGAKTTEQAFNSNPANPTTGRLTHPVVSQAQAQHIAQGWLEERSLDYIQAEGLCMGRTDLKAGFSLEIEGVGKDYGGRYYVTEVVHSYAPKRGYRTRFVARKRGRG